MRSTRHRHHPGSAAAAGNETGSTSTPASPELGAPRRTVGEPRSRGSAKAALEDARNARPRAGTLDPFHLPAMAPPRLRPCKSGSPDPASPFMTIEELREMWRCSRRHIERLLNKKKLTKIKIGRRTLISRSEAMKYAKKQRAK